MKETQPARGLLDPKFKYRPSWDTDVRATIAKARREQAAAKAKANANAKRKVQ